MITAIPNQGGKIAPEFEETLQFTLASGTNTNLDVREITLPQGISTSDIAYQLAGSGVIRVIASNISQEYIDAFESQGIQVFYGAQGSVADGLSLVSSGVLDQLAESGSGCGSGGCGGSCSSGSSGCGCSS